MISLCQLTVEEEYPNSWYWWRAVHSALNIDGGICNPSVCIPVKRHCEKMKWNEVPQRRRTAPLVKFKFSLAWNGMAWETGGERHRQTDRRGRPIKMCTGEI